MTDKTYNELLEELYQYNTRVSDATDTYEANLGSLEDAVVSAAGYASDAEASAQDALIRDVISLNSNTTLTTDNTLILIDATSSDIEITLPIISSYGADKSPILTVKRIDNSAFTVTLSPNNSNTIDALTNITLSGLDSVQIINDSITNWYSL